MDYFILAFLWVIYCVLHSLLAASGVKAFIERKFSRFYVYYRLAYSAFAVLGLAIVVFFQYSFRSPLLFKSILIKYLSVLILVLPGVIIMGVSLSAYFKLFRGLRSLYISAEPVDLNFGGIHKYVRHPLYSGTLLFVWGLFFIFPMLNNLIAVVIITAYVLIGIQFEEKKLVKTFGEEYRNYMKMVPGLIPHIKINFEK